MEAKYLVTIVKIGVFGDKRGARRTMTYSELRTWMDSTYIDDKIIEITIKKVDS